MRLVRAFRSHAPALVGTALLACAGCSKAAPQSRAVLDRTSHDFGIVRQNADLTTAFTLANRGDAELHVKSLQGNCGCIVAKATTTTLAPGAEATIDVTLHTFTMVGAHTKWIEVATDDPANPRQVLELSADISAGLVVEPAGFFFPLSLAGTVPAPRMVLKWHEGRGAPFHVTRVDVSGVDAEAVASPFESPPWKGVELTLRFRRAPPIGTVAGRATITTDSPDVPTIDALIGGAISGKVWISQTTTSFGPVTQGKGAHVRVLVRGFDSTIDLGEVTATVERGQVTATVSRPPDAEGGYAIDVRLPTSAPEGPVRDLIRVTTRVPGEEVIELPVEGTVTPAPR